MCLEAEVNSALLRKWQVCQILLFFKLITQLLIKAFFKESQKKVLHHLQCIVFNVCHLLPRLVAETPDITMPSFGAFEYGCAILFPLVAQLSTLVAAGLLG